MTGDLLKTFYENLGGPSLDSVFFYQLVNMKKNALENSRDWMTLRKFDSSITFSSSDDYTATKSLPARFLRTYTVFDRIGLEQPGVYIVDGNGAKYPLKPIPFANRFDYKDVDGYYYIDVANNKIGRTGTLAGTLHLFFLQGTEDISSSSEWAFPTFAHPLLSYEVVIEQRGGMDWDRIAANQVPFNRDTVNKLQYQLSLWDSQLQQAELGV